MLSTRNQRWLAATAALCAGIVAAGWFLLVSPRRDDSAALDAQTVQAQQQNEVLQQRIAQLKQQFAELPTHQAELAAIHQEMPEDVQMPVLVRDLNSLAARAGVHLTSITPQLPTQVAPLAAGAPAAAGSAGTGKSGAAGNAKVYGLQTSVVVSGDYVQISQFLSLLQTQMRRAFLVSKLTVGQNDQAGSGSSAGGAAGLGNLSATIDGSIFVLQDDAAPAPATAGSAGSAGAAGSRSAGTSGAVGSSGAASAAAAPGSAPPAAALPARNSTREVTR